MGVGNRERPQQHGVNDRENRGVDAETDGQRKEGGEREAAILDEEPDARLQIAGKSPTQCANSVKRASPPRRLVRASGCASLTTTGSASTSSSAIVFQSATDAGLAPRLFVGKTLVQSDS